MTVVRLHEELHVTYACTIDSISFLNVLARNELNWRITKNGNVTSSL